MKKTIILIMFILIISCNIFAGGKKEVVDYEPLTSEAAGGYTNNLKWIYIDTAGNQKTVAAKDGESQPENAIGYVYTTSDDNKEVIHYTREESSTMAGWMDSLGNVLDSICFRFIMAIHPFPNVLFQMYSTNINNNSGSMASLSYTMTSTSYTTGAYKSSYLLIDNNFYNTNLSGNIANNRWKVSISEDVSSTGTSSRQYQKWSLITVLFVTMFAAEMLFMSIWGYVTGTTENVLKEIAKKAGLAFVLFVLVSALPFLLESMRYGFFRIAKVFYGEVSSSYYTNSGYSRFFQNPGEIFSLPGSFLKQMKIFFASSGTFENGTKAISSMMGDYDKSYGIFVDLLMWLLLLIFRFVMFFACLKASLHIAVNLIEVYLLLGLTMILTPFAIFEPVKPIGAKCIMSLITNLIECFVILVLIVCVVPVSVTVCSEILNKTIAYQNEELLYTEIKIGTKTTESVSQTNYFSPEENSSYVVTTSSKPYAYSQIYVDENFVVLLIPTSGSEIDKAKKIVNLALVYTKLENIGSNEYFKRIIGAIGTDYAFDVTDGGSISEKAPVFRKSSSPDYDYKRITFSSSSNSAYVLEMVRKLFVEKINSLLAAECYYNGDFDSRSIFAQSLVDYYNNDIQTGYLGNHFEVFGKLYLKNYRGNTKGDAFYALDTFYSPQLYTGTGSSRTTLTFFSQMLLCFMGVYIPVFFVQQSTQITNALMNGTAAMESLSNALDNVTHTIARTMKNVVGAAVKAVGSIAKTAVKLMM